MRRDRHWARALGDGETGDGLRLSWRFREEQSDFLAWTFPSRDLG
jgi:hypothetical protein